jgi:ferrous iron transport protein A
MVRPSGKKTSNAARLSSAPLNAPLMLASAECGRGLAFRLASMGLRPGALIQLLRSRPRGPVIVAVGNTRVALGRGIAERLFVVPADGGQSDSGKP